MKYALLGLGGYLIWRSFFSNDDGPVQETGPVATPVSAAVLTAIALAAADEGNLLNFDQWNWYYTKVRNTPGPAWEAVEETARAAGIPSRGTRITIDEWHGLVQGFIR